MKWLREPLVHFLLLGALLFGLFALWGGPAVSAPGQYHIVVTPTMVQNLVLGFQRSAGRAPNSREIDGLVAGFVREEILFREAKAINLDQDDPLVRNQLRGRMEDALAERAGDPVPTDVQLADFMKKNADALRRPDGSMPALAEVRDKVTFAWQHEQRLANANAAYEELRKHYVVEVQKEEPAKPASSAAAISSIAPAASSASASAK